MENMEKNTARCRRSALARKTAAIAAALAASALLSACGSKEYLKDIRASDYVTLGNYIGVEGSVPEPAVEDGLVDMYIQSYILPKYATVEEVTDRAVETGDTANIDFVGYIDGKAFDGGKGSDFDLVIGSHSFIDGFEEGLVGVKVGENVTLDLQFPDSYENNPALSGVPVAFDVTVNSIRKEVLPELTDAFVASMGIEGCSTVKELRDDVYNYFYETQMQTYWNTIETTLTDSVMAGCTFKEPPAKMTERFKRQLRDVMNASAASRDMTLADYMKKYYGLEPEGYEEKFGTEARVAAQQFIMFQAIADLEGLNPTEEQLQEEIADRVEAYGFESEKKFRESTDVEMLKEQIMSRYVMEFLKENSNITTVSTIVD